MGVMKNCYTELLQLAEGYEEGFGYDEFLKSEPSMELLSYVTEVGWDNMLSELSNELKKVSYEIS